MGIAVGIVVAGTILADTQVAIKILVAAANPDWSVPQNAPIQAPMPAA